MTAAEFGWVVGIMQVKGNFTVHKDGSVSITVTDSPEVTARLVSYLGSGTVRRNNSQMRFFLQRKADVDAVLSTIRPYLTRARQKDVDAVRNHLDTFFEAEVDPYSSQRQVRLSDEFKSARRAHYQLRSA